MHCFSCKAFSLRLTVDAVFNLIFFYDGERKFATLFLYVRMLFFQRRLNILELFLIKNSMTSVLAV